MVVVVVKSSSTPLLPVFFMLYISFGMMGSASTGVLPQPGHMSMRAAGPSPEAHQRHELQMRKWARTRGFFRADGRTKEE